MQIELTELGKRYCELARDVARNAPETEPERQKPPREQKQRKAK